MIKEKIQRNSENWSNKEVKNPALERTLLAEDILDPTKKKVTSYLFLDNPHCHKIISEPVTNEVFLLTYQDYEHFLPKNELAVDGNIIIKLVYDSKNHTFKVFGLSEEARLNPRMNEYEDLYINEIHHLISRLDRCIGKKPSDNDTLVKLYNDIYLLTPDIYSKLDTGNTISHDKNKLKFLKKQINTLLKKLKAKLNTDPRSPYFLTYFIDSSIKIALDVVAYDRCIKNPNSEKIKKYKKHFTYHYPQQQKP